MQMKQFGSLVDGFPYLPLERRSMAYTLASLDPLSSSCGHCCFWGGGGYL